jgi:hydrogenase maturation protease
VRLLDAGTDGMAAMFAARGCASLILVDASRSGSMPGAVFEVPGSELEASPPSALSLHDFRWDHALFAGRRMYGDDFPADVTVLLVEAATIDFGLELSPPVAAAAQAVAERIEHLVRERLA